MGSQFLAAFMMLLLTISGGNTPGVRHNDVLDFIPTDAYWHAKNVTVTREQLEAAIAAPKPPGDLAPLVKNLESLSRRDEAKKQLLAIGPAALQALSTEVGSADPEAAAMAREIIDSISQHGKEGDVRRLMAIRTLGERKESDSLPLLKTLVDSKDMFVAEYADRAIGQITGGPVKPQEISNLADDLKMLPSTTGIVGQTIGVGLPGYTLDSLMAQMAAAAPTGAPAGQAAARDNLIRQLLDIVEAIGNCRADGTTLAISADIGGSNEWVLMSFRGTYDREAFAAYAARINNNKPTERVGDLIRLQMDREAMVLFPSDHQLIMATANPSNTPLAPLLDPLTEAITTGKPGTLADNKELDALLKTVDKTGVAWIAGIPSAKMRTMQIFGAFNTMALEAKLDTGAIKITGAARGSGNAQSAIDEFNSGKADLLSALGPMLQMTKDFQPLLDAVQSATATADDKGAVLTATASPEIVKSAIVAIIATFRFTASGPMERPADIAPQRGLP